MSTSNFGKYAQYVLTEPKANREILPFPDGAVTDMIYLDNDVIKGAFNVICAWFWPHQENYEIIPDTHFHANNEVIAFFGTDPGNPKDLGGEIEFFMEGHKMTISQSCLIYIPGNMQHCPLKVIRIDRPIFHFSAVAEGMWTRQH